MRKDLKRMEFALKQVKNPNFEIKPQAASTTSVDLNVPKEEIKIDPKIEAGLKASRKASEKAKQEQSVVDSHISTLYRRGGSTKKGWSNLSTAEQREALINKDTRYLHYSTN